MGVRIVAAAVVAVTLASCSGGVYDTSDFVSGKIAKAQPSVTSGTTADKAPAAQTAASGTPQTTTPTPVKVATARASGSLLAMFGMGGGGAPETTGSASTAAVTEIAAVAPATPIAPEPDVEEISEAELAGEQEADPAKIAPPEPPYDDGLEHDFVNVYTSKPEKPVEMMEGLPGVSWEGNLVLASRTPDEGSLFDGAQHPFARSVPGVPRQVVRAANGLLLAHSAINVSCLKPQLVNLVRRAESHFGKKVVITSGYRSPSHNRRVRGALHSQHMYCAALDLFMPGVARDDLARYFFAQPDRGGIGLYCHTRSIHVDVGRKRQWRWPCRRKLG